MFRPPIISAVTAYHVNRRPPIISAVSGYHLSRETAYHLNRWLTAEMPLKGVYQVDSNLSGVILRVDSKARTATSSAPPARGLDFDLSSDQEHKPKNSIGVDGEEHVY
jgi:hypothetical protein